MKRADAERKYPIVREIRRLGEEFERMRGGAIKNFSWTPETGEEIKTRIRATVELWQQKCRAFKKQSICGVAINAPAEQLLELCGVEN